MTPPGPAPHPTGAGYARTAPSRPADRSHVRSASHVPRPTSSLPLWNAKLVARAAQCITLSQPAGAAPPRVRVILAAIFGTPQLRSMPVPHNPGRGRAVRERFAVSWRLVWLQARREAPEPEASERRSCGVSILRPMASTQDISTWGAIIAALPGRRSPISMGRGTRDRRPTDTRPYQVVQRCAVRPPACRGMRA